MADRFMRRMRQILQLKQKQRPLFYWLLLSFLSIISLLVLFILYSLGFFQDQIRAEIIKYNTQNLQSTVSGYENHLELVKNALSSFSAKNKIDLLKYDPIPYDTAKRFLGNIRSLSNNSSLFLENVIVYLEHNSYVLDKNRGGDGSSIFNTYLQNDVFSPDYWKRQFAEPYRIKLWPAARFAEADARQGIKKTGKMVIPFAFKPNADSAVLMVALMDAEKLYDSFHLSVNDHFYMLNDQQIVYRASEPPGVEQLPAFDGSSGFIKQGRYYYFHQQGPVSGLTYINVIHDSNIGRQMKWNVTFVSLLALSIVISVFASLYFSMLLNRPVQKILDSIRQLNSSDSRTNIKEFAMIHDQVGHIIQTQMSYGRDLQAKNSLLRHYSYMNKLRNIRDPFHDLKDVVHVSRPFHLILFNVHFKQDPGRELGLEVDRATSYIREFINQVLQQEYDESLIFQVEEDQIVSIVFANEALSGLHKELEKMKTVFDLDQSYCYLSIAVSSRFDNADAFHTAYRQAQKLVDNRIFQDETQIIQADKPNIFYDRSFMFSPAREQEFDISMNGGNAKHALLLTQRMLSHMERKKATARQTNEFCNAIVSQTTKLLQTNQFDTPLAAELQRSIRQCHTFHQLSDVFSVCLPQIAGLIREKAGGKEPSTIEFVKAFLQEHYHEEITLDMIADKLHLTRSYLSTYFKEKTGIYFVDYISMVRIDKAKELLSQPSLKIQEAAAKVGYHSLSSFNRTFRKVTGLTPSEYRRTAHDKPAQKIR